MNKIINIKDLSYPCVTRARAKEASDKLEGNLDSGVLEIDLRDVDIISMSFLDELIVRFLIPVSTGQIIFKINNDLVKDRLSRIAGFRSVAIYYQCDSRKILKVTAKPFHMPTPIYEPVKN